jgi:hypothetical protein
MSLEGAEGSLATGVNHGVNSSRHFAESRKFLVKLLKF